MSRKIAIKAATVAVALGAMTSVAWAELMKLTDAHLDQVYAGFTIYGANLSDGWGFLAFYNSKTGMYVENSSNQRQWKYDPNTDTLTNKASDGTVTVLTHDALHYTITEPSGVTINNINYELPLGW